MGDWDYDIEEVLGTDGETVHSLVVRFSLPDDVTSAAGLELVFEPGEPNACHGCAETEIPGCALIIKSADSGG